ncbi:hypothetical protein [Achromobacter ruhlandii]|uniref:hypothetical protein n=1 Tax=Achromobacter ruhlandii TaxID=72557 RepID=UPI000AC485E9|nr:hypothetical protein [Achromobacter ruhlandii]
MNDYPATQELFGALFSARCSCCSETSEKTCSERAWLRRAQRFVQSYLPALMEARNAAPNSGAWWSCNADRKPVPTLPEYFELIERTADVSASAREQMMQYLERELPRFDKALGRHQGPLCLEQYDFRAMLAANPPAPR